jgi:hypothetical protein
MSAEGIEAFVHAFSMPGGFPSHVNAEVSLSDPNMNDIKLTDRPLVLFTKVVSLDTALLSPTEVSWINPT